MTREEAVYWIENLSGAWEGKYREERDMAIDALCDQQESKPQWISVKDRMPEPGVNVLARCFYHECWQMFVCHVSKRNQGNWYTGIAGQWVQVTHWMPLPEPPEDVAV